MVKFISHKGMYISPLYIAILLKRVRALSSETLLSRDVIDGDVVLENSIRKICFGYGYLYHELIYIVKLDIIS